MLDMNSLLASSIWGSIGIGFFIYGKKCGVSPALIGGLAILGVSYFVASALFMSLISIALIAGTIGFIKHGY